MHRRHPLFVLSLSLAARAATSADANETAAPTAAATPSQKSAPPRARRAQADRSDHALAEVDANLARLASLDVFEVGQLLVQAPEGAYNCYGPCPEFEDEIAAARQDAAVRLASFTERAMAAEPEAGDNPDPAGDLAALRALQVVAIGELLETEPESNPRCYGFPCSEDIAAAEAHNDRRARKLAAIAAAVGAR